MGALAKFVKDPNETKRYVVTWEDWLDTGEVLESAVFEISVDTGPDDAIPMVIDGFALSTDLLAVIFYASGGDSGTIYKIIIRVNTTSGQIKEDYILMSVRNN